jgi:hypothetical protein
MKILIIKNNLKYSIAPCIEDLKQWLKEKGFDVQVDFVDTHLPLKYKKFADNPICRDGVCAVKELWGLDSIKEQIRAEGIVPTLKYQIVYFVYDPVEDGKEKANWTYPNDLNSAAFCEITTYKNEPIESLGYVLKHETMHAFLRILMWKGIYIIDVLDNDHTLKQVEWVWKLVEPYKKKITEEFSVMKKIWFITDLINYLKSLLKVV